jgi:hypothetical protein
MVGWGGHGSASSRQGKEPARAPALKWASRRGGLAIAACLLCLGIAPAARAANPTQLFLSQSAAFSILGHSCGGIQEHVYATGFAPSGYPAGDVYMQTRCGGSGRGGGYKYTTYSAWASVAWDWFGETRSYARLEGAAEGSTSFSAEDAHGDRIYNVGTSAYLETGEPPLQPPGTPTGLSASVGIYEAGETEYLRMTIGWTPAAETAGLITSSTVTATPVNPGPPVLSTTVAGTWATADLGPVAPNTAYLVTVTNTDAEGTSEPASTELTSPNEDGEGAGGGTLAAETCEANSGTIKLSPGLSETPHVQNITVKGRLSGCDGSSEGAEATYVDHLKTTEEVTCSTLSSLSAEPTTSAVSLVVKWVPKGAGVSHGTLVMALTEAAAAGLSGTLEGGPFQAPVGVLGGTVWESFTGGPTCGVAEGKKKAKAVKRGTFSGTALELG